MIETCQGDQKHRINRIPRQRAAKVLDWLFGAVVIASCVSALLMTVVVAIQIIRS